MTELIFLFAASMIAAIPALVWYVLLGEWLQLPRLGWIGAALIFWLILYYMVSGKKLMKDNDER